MSSTSWNSPYELWHRRAQPFREPFSPSREHLLFAVLLNAPVENNGFTLAFFSHPKEDGYGNHVISVDAQGHPLLVKEEDASGILELSKNCLELPHTGGFRNTWAIKRPTTSQPIHRLFVFSDQSGNEPHQISVQGFTKESRTLQRPVQGIEELPSVLWELSGLALEAREDHDSGGGKDEAMLSKVREVVDFLF
ncbi:hypothetical protein H0H93_014997 [Arthromyces matolae]|nr:hypothetical protein H0H93_014997 [Arthromyces matolae]